MKTEGTVFSIARRRILTMLGVGVAATVLEAVSGSNKLFARQFVSDTTRVKIPRMIYDPELQMMVDPESGVPIYEDMDSITVASGLPTVTSSSPEHPCSDCPKKDDDGA